jgi:hypothetical protein
MQFLPTPKPLTEPETTTKTEHTEQELAEQDTNREPEVTAKVEPTPVVEGSQKGEIRQTWDLLTSKRFLTFVPVIMVGSISIAIYAAVLVPLIS